MTKKVKLIRDKLNGIPGSSVIYCNGPQRHALLVAKLHEEVQEIAENLTDPMEYADLYEVLLELADNNGVTLKDILNVRFDKLAACGGFSLGKLMIVD